MFTLDGLGLAVGSAGLDYSRDGGRSWRSAEVARTSWFHVMGRAVDGRVVWLAGPDGDIATLRFN